MADLFLSAAAKTIKNFERGASMPYERTLRDIQKSLEDLGIEFVFDEGEGVGIRIRRAARGRSKLKGEGVLTKRK
jgi:hypothetical protein